MEYDFYIGLRICISKTGIKPWSGLKKGGEEKEKEEDFNLLFGWVNLSFFFSFFSFPLNPLWREEIQQRASKPEKTKGKRQILYSSTNLNCPNKW